MRCDLLLAIRYAGMVSLSKLMAAKEVPACQTVRYLPKCMPALYRRRVSTIASFDDMVD